MFIRNFVMSLLCFSIGVHGAFAAEFTVLSGGAIEPGLKAAAAAFSQETGHSARITFNTAPQIRERISKGESWDVFIAPPATIEELSKSSKSVAESAHVGKVGIGIAIRPGAPVPQVASTDDFKQVMLDAESVVYNRASSGTYIENMFKKMGIQNKLDGKTTRYPDGAAVMHHVLKGKGREIGLGPMTEIMLLQGEGLVLVGPLPPELQNLSSYTAVATSGAADADATRAFVRYPASPPARALFIAAGINP